MEVEAEGVEFEVEELDDEFGEDEGFVEQKFDVVLAVIVLQDFDGQKTTDCPVPEVLLTLSHQQLPNKDKSYF